MNKKKQPPSVWESLGQFSALGFIVAIPLALGYYLGAYLDGVTHHTSLFTLFGLLLGLVFGIYGAYLLFKRFL